MRENGGCGDNVSRGTSECGDATAAGAASAWERDMSAREMSGRACRSRSCATCDLRHPPELWIGSRRCCAAPRIAHELGARGRRAPRPRTRARGGGGLLFTPRNVASWGIFPGCFARAIRKRPRLVTGRVWSRLPGGGWLGPPRLVGRRSKTRTTGHRRTSSETLRRCRTCCEPCIRAGRRG
jgi:hypothetical protein